VKIITIGIRCKSSTKIDQDDLKKQIDKNEAQRKVLEKMAQILKEKNT